jgi:AcrR family transcriptional regulator
MITATTVDVMAEPQRLDGRRARREQNVDAVVDAMLDLLGEGQLNPGAAAVAERSGVSLRSVFRYFDDMDSLTERAIARQMERAAPLFDLLDDDGPAEVRAGRLAAHRALQHGRLAPYARVAVVRSAAYPVIARGLATRRDALRRQVESLFAIELDALDRPTRDEVLSALEAATSFEVVDLLVAHRGLPIRQVEAVLVRAVVGILHTAG